MRETALPSLLVAGPDGRPRAAPNLDEDEATLAVDAARALLARAGVAAESIAVIHTASPTASAWTSHVVTALGLRHARVDELGAAAFDERLAAAPKTGSLELWLHSRAPRAAILARNPQAEGASATAELTGTLQTEPGLSRASPPPRLVEGPFLDRLQKWDETAASSVPMGAYVPRTTWDRSLDARYRLVASRCTKCNASHHPPLDACARCGGATIAAPAGPAGRLYTFTVIGRGGAPSEFDPWQDVMGEYAVGVAEFAHGLRIAGMLTPTAPDRLFVNAPLEPVFRRLYGQEGAWRYGTKLRVVEPTE